MKASVVVFPGSNCDRDIAVALKKWQAKLCGTNEVGELDLSFLSSFSRMAIVSLKVLELILII